MNRKRIFFTKAQAMLEYLLLTAAVAFLIFSAFGPNGILKKTNNVAAQYYNAGAEAIKRGRN